MGLDLGSPWGKGVSLAGGGSPWLAGGSPWQGGVSLAGGLLGMGVSLAGGSPWQGVYPSMH